MTREELELLADLVAERVADRLAQNRATTPAPALVDAVAVARTLGVSRDLVYARAAELGARRIGDGPRPRLRFVLEEAVAAWTARCPSKGPETQDRPSARRSRSGARGAAASGRPLLPVAGLEE